MRRLLLGVSLSALVALAAAPGSSASFDGVAAKQWAGRIAAVGPRPAGRKHERQAGAIVRARLQELGYAVTTQRFRLPEGTRSLNVVGRTPGLPKVIVVAHMDGMPGTHAANDNASGVGLMLMVAQYLRNRPGVLVAAVGAEERRNTGSGFHLGSRRLARSLSQAAKENVRLAVSLDMVAVGTTLNVRGLEASPNRSARRLLAGAKRRGIAASYLRDTGQSDHDQFTYAGVPAAWLEWRWDPCWHDPCDQIHRLSPAKMRRAGIVVRNTAGRILR
jgi:hypothetical protein